MLKLIFSILTVCYISYSQVSAGLIDSLAVVNNKNASIAESLPKKKNQTSKYAYLKDDITNKSLKTVIDAHKPVDFQLQAAAQQLVDVNKLSEKQLEAIGDAAFAEKLADKSAPTSERSRTSTHAAGGGHTPTIDVDSCDDKLK